MGPAGRQVSALRPPPGGRGVSAGSGLGRG